jgi:Protein of unknown function (DUF2510)
VSTPPVSPVPAGWYPAPEGGGRLRWWDGTQWTEHVQQQQQQYSAAPAAPTPRPALTAPAGTDWKTPWIWLVLFLPLLPLIPLLFVDWGNLVRIDPVTLEADPRSQFAVLTSPAYLATVLGGWLVYALVVVSAFLDWRDLGRRGVPEPFHWAWSFLGSTVYGIGRGVVTQRRTGGGAVVMWVAIGLLVLGLLLGIGIATAVTAAVITQIPFS